MGVFHIFKIVQMLPNRAMHHTLYVQILTLKIIKKYSSIISTSKSSM